LIALHGRAQVERQLLLHGWAQLHTSDAARAALAAQLGAAREVSEVQLALVAVGAHGAVQEVMPLVLVPAKTLLETQDLHPLALADCLPAVLAFCHGMLVGPDLRRHGPAHMIDAGAEMLGDLCEKLLVRCMLLLRNSLCTAAYVTPLLRGPPSPQAAAAAHHHHHHSHHTTTTSTTTTPAAPPSPPSPSPSAPFCPAGRSVPRGARRVRRRRCAAGAGGGHSMA
jgi:hypothetical protein